MTTEFTERVLFIDDDSSVLDAIRRQHRKRYNISCACGPDAGLAAIQDEGPFAVVVTDFNMPGMNGNELLSRVESVDPHLVRVMLTGQADLQTAVDAVNRGHVFRFLCKPCDSKDLARCLDAALEQYRLVFAERELLERTVNGAIEVLVDVLSLASPSAFGRARRVRELVRHIVGHLNLADGWQYETAALLSQIGLVAVPDDTLERMAEGQELPPDELAMLDRHTEVARDLLIKIPRLNTVAEMVYRQDNSQGASGDNHVVLGARMLAAANAFCDLLAMGATPDQAMRALRKDEYDTGVLDAIASARINSRHFGTRTVSIRQLCVGMVIQDDVRNRAGNLVVTAGHEVTQGSLERLRNYSELDSLQTTEFRIEMGAAPTSLCADGT